MGLKGPAGSEGLNDGACIVRLLGGSWVVVSGALSRVTKNNPVTGLVDVYNPAFNYP